VHSRLDLLEDDLARYFDGLKFRAAVLVSK
jgi:hypothetical protein